MVALVEVQVVQKMDLVVVLEVVVLHLLVLRVLVHLDKDILVALVVALLFFQGVVVVELVLLALVVAVELLVAMVVLVLHQVLQVLQQLMLVEAVEPVVSMAILQEPEHSEELGAAVLEVLIHHQAVPGGMVLPIPAEVVADLETL